MPAIQIGGVELYYESTGVGDAVVLIHGLGSWAGDWAKQVEALSSTFRVIAVDLRGHGRSGKPSGPYSVESSVSETSTGAPSGPQRTAATCSSPCPLDPGGRTALSASSPPSEKTIPIDRRSAWGESSLMSGQPISSR